MAYLVITKIGKGYSEYYSLNHWADYRTYDKNQAYHFIHMANALKHAEINNGSVQYVEDGGKNV